MNRSVHCCSCDPPLEAMNTHPKLSFAPHSLNNSSLVSLITVKKIIEQIDVFFNKLTEVEGDRISIPHHLESYVLKCIQEKCKINTK